MTRKQREYVAKALKNLGVISHLISPNALNLPSATKEVKIEEHDLDMLQELAEQTGHVRLTQREIVTALSDYYLMAIQPLNPYMTGFRFTKTRENGKNFLNVFATICVHLKPRP